MKEIEKLLEKPLLEIGILIDDIEFIIEDKEKILRITIDKQDAVDLDTCVNATHVINKILDEKDPIDESYVLEVCSKRKGGA